MTLPKPTGRFTPTANGYARGEVVSALQKAIRRSDERAAMFWAQELADSGYIEFAWKRLRIIASEDIGVAWQEGPAVVRALYENHRDGLKTAKQNDTFAGSGVPLFLTHAVLLLARAPKSRIVDHAVLVTRRSGVDWEIPDEALDRHTARGKAMGRGVRHFFDTASRLLPKPLLPDPYRADARRLALADEEDGQRSLFSEEVDEGLHRAKEQDREERAERKRQRDTTGGRR